MSKEKTLSALPPYPKELLELPGELGRLQDWIYNYQTYPCKAVAGLTALATATHFAMVNIGVDSLDGLALNEQFLFLAPTGFGKDGIRKAIEKIAGDVTGAELPTVVHAMPNSLQGLHSILMDSGRCLTILSDEFGEWLKHSGGDGHKQMLMGHLMQSYTRGYGTLSAPATTTIKGKETYTPIRWPRIMVLGMSTAERMLEALTVSQGDSGVLNRFVYLLVEQSRIPKRYDIPPLNFVVPGDITAWIEWITAQPETKLKLTKQAKLYQRQFDTEVFEPIKFTNPQLGARLEAQGLRMAALIALAHRRTEINELDLATAFAIREGLHNRVATFAEIEGVLGSSHPTVKAADQLRGALERKGSLTPSQMRDYSRAYKALSVIEQKAVTDKLIREGVAVMGDRGKLLLKGEGDEIPEWMQGLE